MVSVVRAVVDHDAADDHGVPIGDVDRGVDLAFHLGRRDRTGERPLEGRDGKEQVQAQVAAGTDGGGDLHGDARILVTGEVLRGGADCASCGDSGGGLAFEGFDPRTAVVVHQNTRNREHIGVVLLFDQGHQEGQAELISVQDAGGDAEPIVGHAAVSDAIPVQVFEG